MIKSLTLALGLFLSASLALAQQPEPQAATPPAESAAPAPAADATPLPAKTVPKLNIVWDCGACTVNDKVIPLLIESYRREAAKWHHTVSETHVADVKIHDYRQRPPGARVMLGIMAGKDRLGLKINYNGQEFEVSDYSANSVQGMNALCDSVAEKAYEKMVALTK